ncbi:Membrane-bound lytic murein transglycosylase F [bioreactor metagenome]|uniref:Membrane-bound lytic murein transglycosylase F n=1 Tax=bioreactor metagenome TaxID=1076179 RepID=A0A644YIC6_9ZZZZ
MERKKKIMKKKLLALSLVAVMAAGVMAGCSTTKKEEQKPETKETTDAAKTETTGEKKKYVIATDTVFPPFEFTDASGKFVGIDVDVINAIAEDQGFEVDIQSLGFDAALLAVQSGQADGVIAGMSITDARKETFDFSNPYFDADVTMAVAKGSGIKAYEDLKGKTVAVKTATNGADYAKSIADKYGFTVVEFKDSPTMYQDVIAGNTVACFEDYPVMAYNIKQGAELEIPEGMTAAGSQYGFAVAKGSNPELLEKFNAGLKNIMDSGKFQEIVDSYTK